MSPENESCLLVLIADFGVRDALVDWLLGYHNELVFSTTMIDCHGLDPDSLNVAEQVSGRQQKLEFQIQLPLAAARELCAGLRREFPGANLRYWIQPVLDAGYLC